MEKKPKPHKQIALLNLPDKDSDAQILTRFTLHGDRDNVCVEIRDCSRKIVLHSNLYNAASYQNALFKIDTLVQELAILRGKIVDAEPYLKERFGPKKRKSVSNVWL